MREVPGTSGGRGTYRGVEGHRGSSAVSSPRSNGGAGGEREELGRSEEGKKDVHAEGMLVAEGPGRLVVTLSNEHSWVWSKQVYVSVEVGPLGVEEGVPPAAEPEPSRSRSRRRRAGAASDALVEK